jgi:hypothetical protein
VNGAVVVDTNVFTAPLRKGRPLEAPYAKHTVGRQIAVTPQTVGFPGLDLRIEPMG